MSRMPPCTLPLFETQGRGIFPINFGVGKKVPPKNFMFFSSENKDRKFGKILQTPLFKYF